MLMILSMLVMASMVASTPVMDKEDFTFNDVANAFSPEDFGLDTEGTVTRKHHMCIIFCFDPSTSVELANGKMIAVEDLKLGDEIVSCRSEELGNCANHYLDTVTDVAIIEKHGPFPAHTFVFENGRQMNVTSPHIMYTYEMKAGELIPVTTAAKDVRENDVMMLQGGAFSRVTKVIDIQLNRKVSINTAGGSFFANGVLTTGMCENYNPVEDLNISATSALEKYAYATNRDDLLTAKEFSIESPLGASLPLVS